MFIILMLIFVRVPKTAIDIFVLDAGGFVGGVFEGGEGLILVTRGWGGGLVDVSCRWGLRGWTWGGEERREE